MKIAKSLLLGSAAGFMAVSGVQAADLPVAKAAPVEYVRVCSTYGNGFFYVPGTDSCLKIGGRVRAEYAYVQTTSRDRGNGVRNSSDQNATGFRARGRLDVDSRTPTDYGTLRTFIRAQITHDSGRYAGATTAGESVGTELDRAFIQWAGITAGRTQSFFDFYTSGLNWHAGFNGNAGSDRVTNVLAYTATFGSGFSATLSLEDRTRRNVAIGNVSLPAHVNNSYGAAGERLPDVVGVLRVDQDWGSAQLSGALHRLASTAIVNALNSPRVDAKYGWAVQGGVNLKLPALSAGDQLWLQAAYADGALNYLGISSISHGDFGVSAHDGVLASRFDNAGNVVDASIKNTKGWNITGGLLHYWTPSVRQAVWGTYTDVSYSSDVKRQTAANGAIRDFNAWTVGSNLTWSPVRAFDIGVEVLYTKAERKRFAPANDTFVRGYRSEDQIQGRLRLQRDF